jgi:hypothetical protein
MMGKRQQVAREPRVAVRSKVVDGRGELKNISRTGALIATDRPLPIGSILDLNHEIAGEPALVVEGVAEVVRNHENPVGMGVVFIMLTDSSRNALKVFLERQRS